MDCGGGRGQRCSGRKAVTEKRGRVLESARRRGVRVCAVLGALRDRRFPPIQAKELPYLECTVSILTDYETANHYLDWEVGKHGIIIEFTDPDNNTRRSATYLPEVAAHEGAEQWADSGAVPACPFQRIPPIIFQRHRCFK
ncbi:hypothetical protein FH972_010328 [Carpinus fangiana]|uniref:AMMECR1 domain-containing protein n=1 Tax=Carpinus fangiana TaxID=176857 RepID=A0A660KR37_9ROSI|nr:hypothetical protein FH972_010328 [Carpinus fangiana]